MKLSISYPLLIQTNQLDLKLFKNDISTQLSGIFNVSFSTGVFPSILKIAKVIPIHEKQSKLDYSNYRPISLLSNLEKMLQKLMYSRIFKFFNKNNSIYPLQFGFRQKIFRNTYCN